MIAIYNYNDDGNICYQHKYEYNKNGDCITYFGCDNDNVVGFEYHYSYTYYD